jgi:hypothetical protein
MRRTLLWWIPAALLASVALVEGAVRVGARAVEPRAAAPACSANDLAMDIDGDGKLEHVRLVRVDDDAWADVYSANGSLRSSTRVGAWHESQSMEGFDADGDGQTDLVRRWKQGDQSQVQVWRSNGNAFEPGSQGPIDRTCVAMRK